MNYHCKNFIPLHREILILQIVTNFLAIFAQNLTILPHNITFYDLFSLAIYNIFLHYIMN